jgi:DNA-binding transcriptional LysR family regulator
VTLRSGYQPQLEAWLIERQVDLVVTAVEGRHLPGISSRPLVALPLGLLVARQSPVRSAAQLWARDRLDEALICPQSSEIISRIFQRELAIRGLSWEPAIIASSLETVARYVVEGYGIGLTVAVGRPPPGTRLLPLDDFPALKIAALWAGKASASTQLALDEFSAYVRRRWPKAS